MIGRPAAIPLGTIDDDADRIRRGDAGPQIRFGFLVIGVMVVAFGVWASITPLSRGAHVPGQIVVESSSKVVQHFEGGVVAEILVQEGQRVSRGQALIRLDETRTQAERDILVNRIGQDSILEARLIAERDGTTTFSLPDGVIDLLRIDHGRALQRDQEELFSARRSEYSGQLDILGSRIEQQRLQIGGMRGELDANRVQARLIRDELTGLRQLQQQGFASLNRVRSLEREAARLEGEYAARVAEIARTEVAVGESQTQILQLKQTYFREVVSELTSVRARLAETWEQLRTAQDRLTRSVIFSPADGQVVGLASHTVGGVISPGQAIMRIVPAGEVLIIEAQVRPQDIDVVHQGLPAELMFPSLPRRTTPRLRAHVHSISTDTLKTPETGASFYLARLVLETGELERLLPNANIVPGMPVDVLIKAGERTLLEYLIAPWTDLFARAMRED